MTPNTLFNLTLKILGIFFIRDILEALSRCISILVYFPQYSTTDEGFYNLGVALPPLILHGLFAWFLIFRTPNIIRLLKLERDIPAEQHAAAPLHRSVVLTIAIIAAGGWVLVNEIPELFRHAAYYFQEQKIYVRMARPDISYMVSSLVKIFLGLLLIGFNRPLVNLIERKRKSPWHWPVFAFFRRKKN